MQKYAHFLSATKMKTLVLLLLGAIVVQAKVADERGYVYECRVYAGPNYTGEYEDFNEDTPYLDTYFDNTIESVVVTGVWLFYEHVEYNTYNPGYVQYIYGLDYHDPHTYGKISSLRYAGSQTVMNEPGYNLYHGTYFTGKDLYESSDIPDLTVYHQDVSSIIIIGQSSWTFCEGLAYTGTCKCLSSTLYDQDSFERLDVGFYPEIHNLGLYQVKSVRHGCY